MFKILIDKIKFAPTRMAYPYDGINHQPQLADFVPSVSRPGAGVAVFAVLGCPIKYVPTNKWDAF